MLSPRFSVALVALLAVACGDDGGGSGTSSTTSTSTSTSGGSTGGGSTTTAATSSTSSGGATDSGSTGGGSSGGGSTSGASTGSDGSGGSTGAGSTGGGVFTLTSDDFVEGGTIPTLHHIQGGNVSPQLSWVNPPAGTMSYAVFFHDVSISYDHSGIWNIPANVSMLPQDVEHAAMPNNVAGAVQCRNWANGWGYGGPGSQSNTYMFTIHAIDTATINEIDQNSSLSAVKAAFQSHSLGSATLSGQTEGPP